MYLVLNSAGASPRSRACLASELRNNKGVRMSSHATTFIKHSERNISKIIQQHKKLCSVYKTVFTLQKLAHCRRLNDTENGPARNVPHLL
jgi:hypothetical protein